MATGPRLTMGPEPRAELRPSPGLLDLKTQLLQQGPAYEQAVLLELCQKGQIELAALPACETLGFDVDDEVETSLDDLGDEDVFEAEDAPDADASPGDCWEILVRPRGGRMTCEAPDDLCGAARSVTAAGSEILLAGSRRNAVYRVLADWLQAEHADALADGPGGFLSRGGTGTSQGAFARAYLVEGLRASGMEMKAESAESLLSSCLRNARLSWGHVSIPLQAVFGT